MCGIAGLVNLSGDLSREGMNSAVERMAVSMVHRGPDSSGTWVDPGGFCAFSHRRLSIIDTSPAGHQPMESWDKRFCITFNGEIYNFRELKPAIEARGHTFRTKTDTEVLIEALRIWGHEAFLKMDGMYAFALFDKQKKEVLLGRDPFGEKPLYYMATPKSFAFASELQALQQLPFFDDSIGVDELAEYLCFQYVGAPRTLYKNVKKLPPGHYLVLHADGSHTVHRYFEFRPGQGDLDQRSLDDLADELEGILLQSIRRRMISDVPLGAFLSGGVDSSTAVALIRKGLGAPIKTFSIGFNETDETEHLHARRFSGYLGTVHREKILTPDASQFLHEIGGLLDEPNGDSSCLPTYLLSEFAKGEVTVAISGDGGDEMFGGYGRYFATLEEESQARDGNLPGWNAGNAYFSSRILIFPEDHIRGLFGFVPSGLKKVLSEVRFCINSGGSSSLLDRMRKADVENYMPGAVLTKVDRMSMKHSLEVRTPYLNLEVARFAERLPIDAMYLDGVGKAVLKKVACRYLPPEMVSMPKKGFGLPMSGWGCTELLRTAGELLESEDGRLAKCLGKEAIKRFMDRQRGDGFSTYQVWALTVLESYLRHRPALLPKLDSGIVIDMVDTSPPNCQELAFLLSSLKQKRHVFIFCEDTVPPFLGALGWNGTVITPSPFLSQAGIKILQLDWTNEAFQWINYLPNENTRGAVAWFYPKDFYKKLSVQWALVLSKAGFQEITFFDENNNLVGLNLSRFAGNELSMRQIKEMGRPLVQEKKEVRKRAQYMIEGTLRKYPPIKKIASSIIKKFAYRLGTVNMPIIHDDGYVFKSPLGLPNSLENQDASDLFYILEDSVPLPMPGSLYDDIYKFGGGRYTIWNNGVYFSASDNSNPIINGKGYYLLPKKKWHKLLFTNANNTSVNVFVHGGGYAYTIQSPYTIDIKDKDLSHQYVLFENNIPLLPSNYDDISNKGAGRYCVWNNSVYFSSSDNSDPNTNGRKYYLIEKKPEYRDVRDFYSSRQVSDDECLHILERAITKDDQIPSLRSSGRKIVLFTHALSSGGAERQWCCLARELDRRGYSITLILLRSLSGADGHYLPLLKGSNVNIYSIADEGIRIRQSHLFVNLSERDLLLNDVPSYITQDVASLYLLLKDIQPDYMLCQLDSCNITGGLAAWLAGVPKILLSTRNVNPSHFPHFYQEWFKPCYNILAESGSIIMSGNSKVGNDDYADWLGLDPSRFVLIPNGLDTKQLDHETSSQIKNLRLDLGIGEGMPVICGVFRFSEEKRPLTFIEAVSRIKARVPNVRAILAGEGPLEEEIRRRINELHLEDTIHLLGRRTDVAVIMAASDLLLLTSAKEGTPNVILEAQYLGVPVVCTRVGGAPEAVQDGKTGFVCDLNSVDGLAERCIELLLNPEMRKDMGQAGHRFIMEKYSIKSMVEKTLAALGILDS